LREEARNTRQWKIQSVLKNFPRGFSRCIFAAPASLFPFAKIIS